MILVTGGTGFLGGNLVRELVRRGEKVRVLVRRDVEIGGAEAVRGELEDAESLRRAVEGCELVYHLAASLDYFAGQRELDKVNVEGSRNLMEACVEGGVKRVVYSSSVAVTDRTRYGKSKRRAEDVVMEYGDRIEIVVLRFAPIYGPGSRQMTELIGAVKNGVMGEVKKRRPYWTHMVDIRNAVDALLLGKSGKQGVYTIADAEAIEAGELYEMVRKKVGAERKVVPYWGLFLYALVSEVRWRLTKRGQKINLDYLRVLAQERRYEIGEAREGLGYEPRIGVREGIRDLLDWYVASCRKG